MKIQKTVCLFILLGLPTLFFGQANEPIYTKNAHWFYVNLDGQPGFFIPPTHIRSDIDTVILGVTYHTANRKIFRNDGRKVYLLNNDSTEKLVYDFALNAGDTFGNNTYLPHGSVEDRIVCCVDSVFFDNSYHKKICFRGCEWYEDKWIEGIGNMREGFLEPFNIHLDGATILCHFFLNDTLAYINRPYCVGIGITQATIEKSHIKCYPNPANSVITVESSTKIESAEVCDMLGKTVLSTMLPAGISELNISSLSSGVFYIKSPSGVLSKFVVY